MQTVGQDRNHSLSLCVEAGRSHQKRALPRQACSSYNSTSLISQIRHKNTNSGTVTLSRPTLHLARLFSTRQKFKISETTVKSNVYCISTLSPHKKFWAPRQPIVINHLPTLGKGSQKREIGIAFAMKGGGLLSRAINVFSKSFLLKKHLESLPDCQHTFCT